MMFRRSLAPTTAAVAIVAALGAASLRRTPSAPAPRDDRPRTIVASLRAEPRSFNRYVARDLSTTVLTYLMHGALVRINHATNGLEPELAERWELLDDQRSYRLHLRPNVEFSDGAPFAADDVVFSFKAIYDERTASDMADSLEIGGKPLTVKADDPLTVTIQFPTRFGPGLRILDGVPMYPRRLAAALAAGTFRSAWGVSTPAADLAGLGPFVLRRYEPGQRLTLDRNPRFWRRSGGFPRADRVVLEIVPDQDAELLQLDAGTIDLTQSALRPSDVASLTRRRGANAVAIADAGTALDGDLFWINLSPSLARDPRARWLQHPEFRRAVAQSVDRRAFVDTVYLGEATVADSIVSPGNTEWHTRAPLPEYDREGAARRLAGLGFARRGGDGMLHDATGAAARFSLLTQKGNTSLERGAAVVRDSLGALGVQVDVVALEAGALVDRVMRGDYDAAYFALVTTDTDPALNLDFWRSSGSAHLWYPQQKTAATAWESDIDRLMDSVATTIDPSRRRAAFDDVQRIIAREAPVLCFAFARQRIAVSGRIGGVTPAAFRPPLLWNPAEISVRR
jgi:peptide/nickel transport system substrate-binding protein